MDDTLSDGPVIAAIAVTATGGGVVAAATITITDDDVGFVVAAVGGNTLPLYVSELGTSAAATIALTQRPTADVVVLVVSSNTGEATGESLT